MNLQWPDVGWLGEKQIVDLKSGIKTKSSAFNPDKQLDGIKRVLNLFALDYHIEKQLFTSPPRYLLNQKPVL